MIIFKTILFNLIYIPRVYIVLNMKKKTQTKLSQHKGEDVSLDSED